MKRIDFEAKLIIPTDKFVVIIRNDRIYSLFGGQLCPLDRTTDKIDYQYNEKDAVYAFENSTQIYAFMKRGICLDNYLLKKEFGAFEKVRDLIKAGNFVGWLYLGRKHRVLMKNNDTEITPYLGNSKRDSGHWTKLNFNNSIHSGEFLYSNEEYDFWKWFTS